jgi:hypothetical protein
MGHKFAPMAIGQVAGCATRKYPIKYGCKSRLYVIWRNMLARCHHENNPGYKGYGARGIRVCEVWRGDYLAFMTWALSSGYANDLTIERKDNNKGYEPGNCRWATKSEQGRNTRCTRPLVTAFGETKSEDEWVADTRCVVGLKTLRWRLDTGRSIESALTQPVYAERRPSEKPTQRKKRFYGAGSLMSPESVKAAMAILGCTPPELATELGLKAATVRAFTKDGARGIAAIAINAFCRLQASGIPWRNWRVDTAGLIEGLRARKTEKVSDGAQGVI